MEQDRLPGDWLEVASATNPSLQRLRGTIIKETKHTITIRTPGNERKTILKQGCTFKITKQ